MAKSKYPGAGAKVECDQDGTGTTWKVYGYTESITPQTKERQKVEATNLDEDLENIEPGIQINNEFEFLQVWDPSDADDETIDTLFAGKTKAQWRITYPTTPEVTDTFTGWVVRIAPETIDVGTRIGRVVAVQPTTVVARASA